MVVYLTNILRQTNNMLTYNIMQKKNRANENWIIVQNSIVRTVNFIKLFYITAFVHKIWFFFFYCLLLFYFIWLQLLHTRLCTSCRWDPYNDWLVVFFPFQGSSWRSKPSKRKGIWAEIAQARTSRSSPGETKTGLSSQIVGKAKGSIKYGTDMNRKWWQYFSRSWHWFTRSIISQSR